jgi:hypothetical protein
MTSETFKKTVEPRFTVFAFPIIHTTSHKCKISEFTELKDDKDNFRPIKIEFRSREYLNRFLFVIYKCLRILYVAVYFYFLPFIAVIV